MGRTADYSDQVCPVAATLEVIGDPWTLLIVRGAFTGIRRFDAWQEKLGVARNVLAARLKSLVGHGVLVRQLYCERPRRYEYVLTPMGRDLQKVLVIMAAWGDRHIYGRQGGPAWFEHATCGHAFVPGLVCEACGERVYARDISINRDGQVTVGEALARVETLVSPPRAPSGR